MQYAKDHTAGYIQFTNLTTGKHFSMIMAPPWGVSFSGNTVEWIMEAPDFGLPNSALPRFSPVDFTQVQAGGDIGLISGEPQNNGSIFNIVYNNTTYTSAAVGTDAVTIQYVGS